MHHKSYYCLGVTDAFNVQAGCYHGVFHNAQAAGKIGFYQGGTINSTLNIEINMIAIADSFYIM